MSLYNSLVIMFVFGSLEQYTWHLILMYIHTLMYIYIHSYIHRHSLHTYIHTYLHTHTHTHTHIHTYIRSRLYMYIVHCRYIYTVCTIIYTCTCTRLFMYMYVHCLLNNTLISVSVSLFVSVSVLSFPYQIQTDVVIDGLGHCWKAVSLIKPCSCEVCNDIIWSSSLTCQGKEL